MDKQQIKSEILKIKDWRHPYELEPGVHVTLFRDWHKEWHTWRIETLMPTIQTIAKYIIPDGFQSASVLDTGCWDGFYGFEFIKRGAKSVKGIDLREDAIRRANLIKDYFDYSNSTFQTLNIQDIDPTNESFDITLLYGLLYHLSAPIDVIKKLGQMTNHLLLVNTYADKDPRPVLILKREDPGKDSMGFQELITTPSESAIVEMLYFAGFDIILRDYPYPFYEKYKDSDFGFFYAFKSSAGKEKIDSLMKKLNVRDTYDPGLTKHQIVRLKPCRPEPPKPGLKKRIKSKLHKVIDEVL